MTLREQLIRDEGKVFSAYSDKRGYLTIGIGHRVTSPLSEKAVMQILDDDIEVSIDDCRRVFRWFDQLSEARQAVLVNMRFNVGMTGLMGFRRMLAALEDGDYDRAADEMRASDWAMQVPMRAQRLSEQMRTGEWR